MSPITPAIQGQINAIRAHPFFLAMPPVERRWMDSVVITLQATEYKGDFPEETRYFRSLLNALNGLQVGKMADRWS